MSKDPLDETRTCKHCGETWTARRQGFTAILWLSYCTDTCALEDGLTPDEVERQVKQTVWQCAGCKQYFPHEELTHRKGDYGYTPLCQPCADNPEYYCFFPYADRLAAGLVSAEERDEHNRNWNAFHNM